MQKLLICGEEGGDVLESGIADVVFAVVVAVGVGSDAIIEVVFHFCPRRKCRALNYSFNESSKEEYYVTRDKERKVFSGIIVRITPLTSLVASFIICAMLLLCTQI